MAAPKTTIWDLEPHTRAKHEILKRYLQAWTPILSLGGFPEFVYVDGFAGPGRYSKGEDGSPIIALKAALGQRVRIAATVDYVFVEKDPDRGACLQSLVNELALPTNFRSDVRAGVTFERAYPDLQSGILSDHRRPVFAFIDPFGWTGIPFKIVIEILRRPSSEVLVTFMYEEINRFLGDPSQATNFDELFGTNAWRECKKLADPKDRNRCIHDLYMRQLREAAGAQFVRSFEMRNDKDVTDYFLFFATNSRKGLQKMKEAMWKVDEAGEFRFSDATDPSQLVLFARSPDLGLLKRLIIGRFSGEEVTRDVVEKFVLEATAFRETHYKGILKELEFSQPPGLQVVRAASARKRGTFSDPNMRIRFA